MKKGKFKILKTSSLLFVFCFCFYSFNSVFAGNLMLNMTPGNVGIGVAVPVYKLDVSGDINSSGSYKIDGVDVIDLNKNWTGNTVSSAKGGTGLTSCLNGQILKWNGSSWTCGNDAWTPSGSNLYYNVGYVGIGTTTPTQLLTVGNAKSAGNSFYNIGADTIGANTSIYSYGKICAGNNSGSCDGSGGVVLSSDGSINSININNTSTISTNTISANTISASGSFSAPTFIGDLDGNAKTATNADSADNVAWTGVVGKPGWLNGGSYISDSEHGSETNMNAWMNSGFYQNYAGANNPVGTWFNFLNIRHSNQANYHGFQVGMSYYDNKLWFRSYQGAGTFQPWVYAISSGNIGSQSVDHAATAGTADNVAWAGITGKPTIISDETDPKVSAWAKATSRPTYTATDVGLGNVNNTSDVNKPISTATQTALDNVSDSLAAVNSGLFAVQDGLSGKQATLSGTGLVRSTAGAISYDNNTYVTGTPWTAMGYITGTPWTSAGYLLSSDISAWAKATSRPTYTATDVGLGNVNNTSDVNKPISTATQTALNALTNKINTPNRVFLTSSWSSPWTVPAGVTYITAYLIGGGGGGGSGDAGIDAYFNGCYGGNGGGFLIKAFSVYSGQVINYSVGVGGGSNGPNCSDPGSNGSVTSFNGVSTVVGNCMGSPYCGQGGSGGGVGGQGASGNDNYYSYYGQGGTGGSGAYSTCYAGSYGTSGVIIVEW